MCNFVTEERLFLVRNFSDSFCHHSKSINFTYVARHFLGTIQHLHTVMYHNYYWKCYYIVFYMNLPHLRLLGIIFYC